MRLTDHFTVEEFADPATGEVKFPDGFLDDLEILRVDYDRVMKVNSGCRSGQHNNWLLLRGYKASPNSFHLMENPKYPTGGCIALDMARPDGIDLHRLIESATALGWSVGLARSFVHLDRRETYTDLKASFYSYG